MCERITFIRCHKNCILLATNTLLATFCKPSYFCEISTIHRVFRSFFLFHSRLGFFLCVSYFAVHTTTTTAYFISILSETESNRNLERGNVVFAKWMKQKRKRAKARETDQSAPSYQVIKCFSNIFIIIYKCTQSKLNVFVWLWVSKCTYTVRSMLYCRCVRS